MLKSDDLISRFFRISTEMCVELCYRNLNLSEHRMNVSVCESSWWRRRQIGTMVTVLCLSVCLSDSFNIRCVN